MIRYGVIAVIASSILSSANVSAQLSSDTEIRKILADRVYAQNLGIGIVVGVIDRLERPRELPPRICRPRPDQRPSRRPRGPELGVRDGWD